MLSNPHGRLALKAPKKLQMFKGQSFKTRTRLSLENHRASSRFYMRPPSSYAHTTWKLLQRCLTAGHWAPATVGTQRMLCHADCTAGSCRAADTRPSCDGQEGALAKGMTTDGEQHPSPQRSPNSYKITQPTPILKIQSFHHHQWKKIIRERTKQSRKWCQALTVSSIHRETGGEAAAPSCFPPLPQLAGLCSRAEQRSQGQNTQGSPGHTPCCRSCPCTQRQEDSTFKRHQLLCPLCSVRGWGEAQAAASYCFTLMIMTPYKEKVTKTCCIEGHLGI